MSPARWAAAAVLCLAAAVTGCGPARNTLPVVTGAFGTDPLISLPAGQPPGALVVRTLSQGPGPVVCPGDYVLFDVAAKVWAGDRLVIDTFTNHQPQGLPLPGGRPAPGLAGTGSPVVPGRPRTVAVHHESFTRWFRTAQGAIA